MPHPDSISICTEAQRTGYIKLSDLHRILSEEAGCSLETLHRVYTCCDAHVFSKKTFEQLRGSAAATTGLGEGKITAQRIIAGSSDRIEIPGMSSTPDADEIMLRMIVWHWLLKIWAGFTDNSEKAGAALPLYCKAADGSYAPISRIFAPSWFHYVRVADLHRLFHNLAIPLPGKLSYGR